MLARAKGEDLNKDDSADDEGTAPEQQETNGKDADSILPDQMAEEEVNEVDSDEKDDSKDDDESQESGGKHSTSVPSQKMQMKEREPNGNSTEDVNEDVDDEDVEMNLEEEVQSDGSNDVLAQESIEDDVDGDGDQHMKEYLSSEDDGEDESKDDVIALDLTAADLAASREAITKMLALRSDDDVNRAHTIWSRIDSITASGSAASLRTIEVDPRADFSNEIERGLSHCGKRINMRKIIPYIASSYWKDKIWLRRKKPSKRQYQIMIAIDDSESMQPRESTSRSVVDASFLPQAQW